MLGLGRRQIVVNVHTFSVKHRMMPLIGDDVDHFQLTILNVFLSSLVP